MEARIIRVFFIFNIVMFVFFFIFPMQCISGEIDKTLEIYVHKFNSKANAAGFSLNKYEKDKKESLEVLETVLLNKKAIFKEQIVNTGETQEFEATFHEKDWYNAAQLLARIEEVNRPKLTKRVVEIFDKVYKQILKEKVKSTYSYYVWNGIEDAISSHGTEKYMTDDFWEVVKAGVSFGRIAEKFPNKWVLIKLLEIYPESVERKFIGECIVTIEAKLRYPQLKKIKNSDQCRKIAFGLLNPNSTLVGDINDLKHANFAGKGVAGNTLKEIHKNMKKPCKSALDIVFEKYGYGKTKDKTIPERNLKLNQTSERYKTPLTTETKSIQR